MVIGVTSGFQKVLEFEGIGYRVALEGLTLVMQLGFSHSVRFEAPKGITFVVQKNTITITGINKELVGEVAARIRALKPPEPYKGKGIRYQGEVIRRKSGKKAVTSGG
jgi:large subunit ribosomal protein L6